MTEDRDEGLFTPEERDLLKRIRANKTWKLMADALCWERENLFNEEIKTSEQLWRNRGAIEQVQKLLREAPLLVIWYRRYQADRETRETMKPNLPKFDQEDRDYNEPPEFDH